MYSVSISQYIRIHENTSAIHRTYSALSEYAKIRCILGIPMEYLENTSQYLRENTLDFERKPPCVPGTRERRIDLPSA